MDSEQYEAERRRRKYLVGARPESVELVRYTFGRGMRMQTMYQIWGRNFVDACLGEDGANGRTL